MQLGILQAKSLEQRMMGRRVATLPGTAVTGAVHLAKIPPQASEVFHRLNVGAQTDPSMLAGAFTSILEIREAYLRDLLLSAFLTSTMVKGPTVEEVVALIQAAFKIDSFSPQDARKVTLPRGEMLVGCVGSGKKGVKTINVSTPSALIAAGLGVHIVKIGSSCTSSVTGSADFMRAVGANVDVDLSAMIGVLCRTRFGFFQIEGLIPKFDELYGGRFYAPHTLSFGLAALMCPIKLDHMLYGLSHPNIELAIKVLREFGIKSAMVVSCTHDGIHFVDEMGVHGVTRVIGMRQGLIGKLLQFDLQKFVNFPQYLPEDIAGHPDPFTNVKLAIDVLQGRGEAAHNDVICINAANLLVIGEKAGDLREGYEMSKRAIRKGEPLEQLRSFIRESGGDEAQLNRFLATSTASTWARQSLP